MPTAIKDEIREALKELLTGEKHDSAGAPGSLGYVHGRGGMLTYPGVDPDVFSTIIADRPGLMNELPTKGSLYENPTYEVITGIKAGTGTEQTTVCAVAPIGGQMKAGIVTASFGRYSRQTREIELSRLGRRVDRADPVDLRLVNRWSGGRTPFTDASPQGDILTNEMDVVMMERAVEFHRLLSHQLYVGDPANNNAGGGYKEFAGIQLLVNTNWKDAILGTTLPSVYPLLMNFNNADIASNGNAIVNQVTYMARYLEDLADRSGLNPVRWAWVMRPALFYELTKVWPCAYYTTLCSIPSATGVYQQNIDLGDQIALRDSMRAGKYLIMDGRRMDVILDDALPETSGLAGGCFSSDVYLIPLSVQGGRAVTYLEYFQYTNPSIDSALVGNMVLARALENGAYLETVDQTRTCITWQATIEPRLIMRTPWLAGRIQNVKYCPLLMNRQPFPTDPYWVNGGTQTRPGPSYYNPW